MNAPDRLVTCFIRLLYCLSSFGNFISPNMIRNKLVALPALFWQEMHVVVPSIHTTSGLAGEVVGLFDVLGRLLPERAEKETAVAAASCFSS